MDDDRRVIVIGSGPAGAMAAATLLGAGIPVTMLESGIRQPRGLLVRAAGRNIYRKRQAFKSPKRHFASGDPNASWYYDLAPGGLSNHWTGAVPRFAQEDFYDGVRLDDRYRWPVTYQEVAPYYEQVERLMQVVGSPNDVPNLPSCQVAYPRRLPVGWQSVARAAARRGQGLTSLPLADGKPWLVRRSGAAFDSYGSIVRGLRRNPHFQLVLGAHAVRLEWNGALKRVDSVVYVDRSSGSQHCLRGAAFVVAAGALSSTKLLLDSTSPDFPSGLGNTEGILGRYLHDHTLGFCRLDLEMPLPRLGHAAYLTRIPYVESTPLLAASCTLSNRGAGKLDRLLNLGPVPAETFSVITFASMTPSAENYAALHSTLHDDFGFPLLDLHILYGDEGAKSTAASRERLISILEAAGHRARVRDTVSAHPGTSVHYGGTVRMHESPKWGMLDSWNRVHAAPNTLVVDASCFTTGPEKNPTPTIMALATRAAERLAADLKTC